MKKTNAGLVSYARAQLGKPYWWGTFGQYGTKALYDQKKSQYPDAYNWPYDSAMDSTKVHDCSGLVKGYLMCENNDSSPVYNPAYDMNAAGLYNIAREKGHISDMPDLPGLLVFYSALGHVGIYVGGGKVIQAANLKDGVIETYLNSDVNWTHWAKCPYVEYKVDSGSDSTPKDATEILCRIRNTLLNLVDIIDEFQ